MAGEITQEAILLALGGAGLGATGAVAAQIVAAVFTARRENKKALAEEARWKLENDAKRRDRNLDHKIDLFGRFLSVAESLYQDMAWGTQITDEEFHAYQPRMQELRDKAEEIGLIAPEVFRHTQATLRSIGKMLEIKTPFLWSAKTGKPSIEQAEECVAAWIRLTRGAIRSYINYEPVDWDEKELKELGLL
ncbi:hypothetical protein QFZ70_001464 [Arthrobacter sp. V1I9]|uniref:hypothetical protein n=1 Tax=Arthrobacter sp. V1I9 TaxID=3042275 RepID=UPI0027939101|nr:hypothetical protein [Arthrobacter sp. V1I9]MDQ0868991.1 hypothetical protein [Arthrobacter sp. V1I9]